MKKLVPIIVAAVVLAVAAFWVVSQKRGPAVGKAGERVLNGFRPELVAGIYLEGPEGSVRLSDHNGRWGVVERSDYPADDDMIRAMVMEAWNMKAIQKITLGEGSTGRLQLVPPGTTPPPAVAETATRLQFLDAAGAVLAEVLLGLPRTSDPADGMPGRAIGRYVMVPGRETADLVSETFAMAAPAPAHWLDKTFVQIEDPVRLEMTGPDGWVVKRENDGWVPEGEVLGTFQPGLISSAVSMWRLPEFDDLGNADDLPADQPSDEVIITTKGGKVFNIRRGQPQGTRTPIRIDVGQVTHADSSSAGKDESMARLLDGQVFLMPTTFVDALFLKRSDLIVAPGTGAGTDGRSPTAD